MADQHDLARELVGLAQDDHSATQALFLLQRCEDAGASAPPSLAQADLLTPYGVAMCYDARSPVTLDRRTALGFAHAAVEWAEVFARP